MDGFLVRRRRTAVSWIPLGFAVLLLLALPTSCKKKGKKGKSKANTAIEDVVKDGEGETCSGGVCKSGQLPPILVRFHVFSSDVHTACWKGYWAGSGKEGRTWPQECRVGQDKIGGEGRGHRDGGTAFRG